MDTFPAFDRQGFIPPAKVRTHRHDWRQHDKWDTHAVCQVCGFALHKAALADL
jgi:hypothetical protein